MCSKLFFFSSYHVNTFYFMRIFPLRHHSVTLVSNTHDFISADLSRRGFNVDIARPRGDGTFPYELPENWDVFDLYTVSNGNPKAVLEYITGNHEFSWFNQNCQTFALGMMEVLDAKLVNRGGIQEN